MSRKNKRWDSTEFLQKLFEEQKVTPGHSALEVKQKYNEFHPYDVKTFKRHYKKIKDAYVLNYGGEA